jgi:hypothetical protein
MLSKFHYWMRKIYDTFLDPQYAEGKHYAIVFEPNDNSLSIFEVKNPSTGIPLVPACWPAN